VHFHSHPGESLATSWGELPIIDTLFAADLSP
jgi:hypothetical protein